jgi:hypothetical protein
VKVRYESENASKKRKRRMKRRIRPIRLDNSASGRRTSCVLRALDTTSKTAGESATRAARICTADCVKRSILSRPSLSLCQYIVLSTSAGEYSREIDVTESRRSGFGH